MANIKEINEQIKQAIREGVKTAKELAEWLKQNS